MKDLENVEVSYANGDHHSNKIQLTEDIGMMMKYPNFEIMNQMGQSESFEDIVGVVSSCIEIIYQGDEVFNTSDHPISEVMDFVESLTQDQFEKINKMMVLMTVPKIEKIKVVEKNFARSSSSFLLT